MLLPLDDDHQAAGRRLAEGAAAAAGVAVPRDPLHLSLLVVRADGPAPVLGAVARLAQAIGPLAVRAHGYGFFCDGTAGGTSVHVPVVCGPALLGLHRAACAALEDAGAPPATWTDPAHWSPHVTLLDEGLDPPALGRATTWLAGHHHPRWTIPVDRLVVSGPRGEAGGEPTTVLLRGAPHASLRG